MQAHVQSFDLEMLSSGGESDSEQEGWDVGASGSGYDGDRERSLAEAGVADRMVGGGGEAAVREDAMAASVSGQSSPAEGVGQVQQLQSSTRVENVLVS